MKVKRELVEIYNNEYQSLLSGLAALTNRQRQDIYSSFSSLFPKSKETVNLEDQLKNRKDYRHKFKRSFFIIGNHFFSTNHWGEYNQEKFISKTGYKSQRYPQKVILALSMLGYIGKEPKCLYSTSNHGYIYEIDYFKFKKWNQGFIEINEFEESNNNVSYEYNEEENDYENIFVEKFQDNISYTYNLNEWLSDKQKSTIDSISVSGSLLKNIMTMKEYILSQNYDYKDKDTQNQLYQIHSIESLHYKTSSVYKMTTDNYGGRFYSVMTRLPSSYRLYPNLTLNGKHLCEIDISSAQPTLLALNLKRKYPDMKSQWLDHCLNGDFYEWIISITGLDKYPVDNVVNELLKNSNYNDNEKIVSEIGKIDSTDPCKLLRPVCKNWIMRFIFSKHNLKSAEKETGSIYKHFLHNLYLYLKENEPLIYETFSYYRSPQNLIQSRKNPDKKSSQLPMILQQEEVRYIKQCLAELNPYIDYIYTVHDCIGCLVSDSDLVKSIMEKVSVDMYGVKLYLKTEGI